MSGGVWLRRIALLLMTLVVAAAALTLRAWNEGAAAMRESDAAFDRGDVRVASYHARRAAVAYAPGAPHVSAAYARLEAIARGAEAVGDAELALHAWRNVRASALETRHLWVPMATELARANREIARLETAGMPRRRERAEAALAELRHDDAPNAYWALLLGVGFLLTLSGLAWTALSGVAPDGALRLDRARWALGLTLLGAACWTLAAYQA